MKYIVKEDIYLRVIYEKGRNCSEFITHFKDLLHTLWLYRDYCLLDTPILYKDKEIKDEGVDHWFLSDDKRINWLCNNFKIEKLSNYRPGDRFICKDSIFYNEEHILAIVDNNKKVALISLVGDANRWTNPKPVKDPYSITEEEFAKITDGTEFVKKEGV